MDVSWATFAFMMTVSFIFFLSYRTFGQKDERTGSGLAAKERTGHD